MIIFCYNDAVLEIVMKKTSFFFSVTYFVEVRTACTSSISGSISPSGPGEGILRYRLRMPQAFWKGAE